MTCRPFGSIASLVVAVMVDSTELSAVTDDSGRFHITGIPAGRNEFTVRRIGFAAVEFGTTLAPDSTLVIDIRMHALTALDPVTVTAERLKRFESTGFNARSGMDEDSGGALSDDQVA